MLNLQEEVARLLKQYPDPRKGPLAQWEKQEREQPRPRYGTVSDNQDPQKLGRVRVASDMIAPGAVTDWIPVIKQFATKGAGNWRLPDIGTQVLLGFVGNSLSQPVVLGCIYDEKHRPPEHSTKKAGDSIVFETKKHRVEIIDEEGKEGFIVIRK